MIYNAALARKFWSKVEIGLLQDCWLWKAGKKSDDYGVFWGGYSTQAAHRMAWMLAADTYIPAKMFVCHKCDETACCNPLHLWLGNLQENNADRNAKGRQSKGENQFAAKLTEEQVIQIRNMYAAGGWTHRKLGRVFGVTHAVIGTIITRRAWMHVEGGA